MTFASKIPTEIDVQTNDPIKRRNINIYYSEVIRNYDVKNDKQTPFNLLTLEDQSYIRSFCKRQFEKDSSFSYFTCLKTPKEVIVHKKIDPRIFLVLDLIETKIKNQILYKEDIQSLKNIFRVDDKGIDLTCPNLKDKKLSQLCTLVKKYILTSMDGLFCNLVSTKLINAYTSNKLNYEVLISYVPFILSEDEYTLLTRLLEIFKLVDFYKEYTHMNMARLLRLFSLVLFDSKCFTSLDMLLKIENILVDISKLDFQKIPKTVIKKILKFV